MCLFLINNLKNLLRQYRFSEKDCFELFVLVRSPIFLVYKGFILNFTSSGPVVTSTVPVFAVLVLVSGSSFRKEFQEIGSTVTDS